MLKEPSVLRFTRTATNDNPFIVGFSDIWLEYCDIFVYDNNAYFGNVDNQDISILDGDSYNVPYPVKINDLFFKNYTAGSNTRIVIIGTPYNPRGRR